LPLDEIPSEGEIPCSTQLTANTATGDSVHGHYGCSEWSYSGPEHVWEFRTDVDEDVVIDITDLDEDLDVYLMASQDALPNECLDFSAESKVEDEQLTFHATAGTSYWVVLDGFREVTTPYQLSVQCDGEWPVVDPESGDLDKPNDTDDPNDGSSLVVLPPRERMAGCACDAGGTPAVGWWLVLATAMVNTMGRRRGYRP
jgi:hypothetical protein